MNGTSIYMKLAYVLRYLFKRKHTGGRKKKKNNYIQLMSVKANLTTRPDSLFSVLTHLKHEELITGDSDCKLN